MPSHGTKSIITNVNIICALQTKRIIFRGEGSLSWFHDFTIIFFSFDCMVLLFLFVNEIISTSVANATARIRFLSCADFMHPRRTTSLRGWYVRRYERRAIVVYISRSQIIKLSYDSDMIIAFLVCSLFTEAP